MGANFRILKALGSCSTGEFLAVEIDGRLIEGQLTVAKRMRFAGQVPLRGTFLFRTPTGGWMVPPTQCVG